MVVIQPAIDAPRPKLPPVAAPVPLHPRRPNTLPPGWPLTGAIIGYPLWWVIGVAEIVPLVAAALMAVQLLRMRRITVRPGFGWWLVFLAWVAVGVFLLQVSAPNAVPDHSNARYFTFAFRCGWYLAATITLIYVYNMRRRLSSIRLVRAFSWLFVTVVIGGVLGTLRPYIDFPSVLELVLPRGLTHVQYVHDLVHPVMAQLHTVSGVVHPRASAPFAYTNDWGLNYVCLLPFFLVGWLRHGSGWRRGAGLIVLAVSIYPVVMTQNRGAWVALGVTAIVVAVRGWLFGHAKPLVWILVLVGVLGTVLLTTPLGKTVQYRLEHGYSDNGRTNLGQLTVDSVLSKSPVVGLGSTRNVQGAFYSIAGGNSSTCSGCTPPALGTQGHFWLVIFSTGVGGLVLYLGFIGLQLLGAIRRHTTLATLAASVLISHLVTMFFYDTIGIALLTIFAAIGLLWRDLAQPSDVGRRDVAVPDRDRRLGSYAGLVRANAALVIVCMAVGTALGFGYGHTRPHQYSAETSLAIPVEASFPGIPKFTQSLDTVADLIGATQVRAAVRAAGGPSDADISVSATPNSQVLHLKYVDRDPARAARVSAAAAAALDQVRVGLVRTAKAEAVATLQFEDSVTNSLLASIDQVAHPREGTLLASTRDALQTQLTNDATTIGKIESAPAAASTITSSPAVPLGSGATLIGACSGAALGLLVAVFIGFLRDAFGPRVGRRNTARSIAGAWVLARLTRESWRLRDSSTGSRQILGAADVLAAVGVALVVGVDADPDNERAVGRLNRTLTSIPRDGWPVDRVALLAGPRTRVRHIAELRDRLELHGASVYGLILRGQRVSRFTRLRSRRSRTVFTPGPAPAMQRN